MGGPTTAPGMSLPPQPSLLLAVPIPQDSGLEMSSPEQPAWGSQGEIWELLSLQETGDGVSSRWEQWGHGH